MKPTAQPPHGKAAGTPRSPTILSTIFAALFGGFLGVCLMKFGSPPIFEKFVMVPTNFYELAVGTPWPILWAYDALIILVLAGLVVWQGRRLPWLLVVLPLPWLAWQWVAASKAIDSQLATETLHHFLACAACYYLGLLVLARVPRLWPFWLGLLGGFVLVVAIGLDQHFGGLEDARKYFQHQLEMHPGTEIQPEFVKKLASQRIYSTMFYPNALAGALLLLLAPMLAAATELRDRLQRSAQARLPVLLVLISGMVAALYLYLINSRVGWALVVLLVLASVFPMPGWLPSALLAAASLACLIWSGSKGGWLLMLGLGLIVLLRLPLGKRFKMGLVVGVAVFGLAGFFARYAGFFHRGATSVSARFDYWHAALQTTRSHPLFGTGPGTFAIPYQKLKKPDSEMARLVHNDYLEQASDSGIPGFLGYALLIGVGLARAFPALGAGGKPGPRASGILDQRFAAWLGVLGWSLQSFVEFSLYLPTLSWTAFALLGWLLGSRPSNEAGPNSWAHLDPTTNPPKGAKLPEREPSSARSI